MAGEIYPHCPRVATIVTAQAKGKENAMAVALQTLVSFDPPLYAVSLSPQRFTYKLIADSKEFGINFLSFEQATLVAAVGGSKGEKADKFQRFKIVKKKSLKTQAPILEAAYAAYECKLVEDMLCGDHRLLVGEVVAVHLGEEVLTPDGVLDLAKFSPIVYLGKEIYATTAKDTVRKLDRSIYGKG